MNFTPYYDLVPKDEIANLKFRREMVAMGAESKENAHELWMMCARDVLFYINTFVWTFDPRLDDSRVIPFNTFAFQDRAFIEMLERLGKEPLLFNKSRDTGASWMILTLFAWAWHFQDDVTFMLGSRTEAYVDLRGDDKALFTKLDFLLKYLPGWLTPNFHRKHLQLRNLDNNSTIVGEATGPSFGTGGRFTAILLDEFGKLGEMKNSDYGAWKSVADCSTCRFVNGTPNGAFGCFYDLHTDPAFSHIHKINMHWSEDPRKNKGLYKVFADGRVEILDKEYYRDKKYEFSKALPQNVMGYRSPWYDKESKERFSSDVAEQLDMNFLGAGSRFFDEEWLAELIREYMRPPYMTGEFDFESKEIENGEFRDQTTGRFQLWTYTDPQGKIAEVGPYVFGIDVSAGTGASNSVISIGNKRTSEKVGEWVCPKTLPRDFADIAVALGYWFGGAYLKWDAGGGGGKTFSLRIMELNYPNIYYKTDENRRVPRRSETPGYWLKGPSRESLYANYAAALGHTFINRSEYALKECREFIRTPNGIQHSKSIGTDDPSGARENHGDRTTADALCSSAMSEVFQEVKLEVEIPVGSFMWRRLQRQAAKVHDDDDW